MKNNQKGFTLPELLVAAAILAFALCALLVTFISCIFLNEANRNTVIATTHAEYVLEEIENTGFESIATGIAAGGWDWDSADLSGEGLAVLNNESVDTQSSGTNPLTVTVTVSWNDRRGRVRSVVLQTLFTDK